MEMDPEIELRVFKKKYKQQIQNLVQRAGFYGQTKLEKISFLLIARYG